MMLYQIFENIGAFIGLMPLTGITLPFISYGGTSLLINMASIGIVMSVRVHGHEVSEDIFAPTAESCGRQTGLTRTSGPFSLTFKGDGRTVFCTISLDS